MSEIAAARRALSAAMGELEAAVASVASRAGAGEAPVSDDDPRLAEARGTADEALRQVDALEAKLAEMRSRAQSAAAERDAARAARDAAMAERDELTAELERLRAARVEDAAMIEEALAELRDVV